MRSAIILAMAVLANLAAVCGAATYYVDYDAGDDDAAGTSPRAAWKHAPGDAAAAGRPGAVKLQPGDVVRLKGGVVYRGAIRIAVSGEKGRPITYAGNGGGDWGRGRAILDGSVPLTDLKRCASAEEAFGNPHYEHIYWTTVPKGAHWKTLNVCQGLTPVAWSQDPNPTDPVFQERPSEYHKTDPHIPRNHASLEVEGLGGIGENSQRPLIAMFDGSRLSAVVHRMATGAEVKVTLPKPVTVTAFGVTPQANYVHPKEVSFIADGKELLRATLEHHPKKTAEQRLDLPAPATFKTLIVKFHSAYQRPGKPDVHFGAVRRIAGYDEAGRNVLLARDRKTLLRNDEVFTQDDPSFYDNALMALFASPNFVYYKRIIGYDPASHTIATEILTPRQKPYTTGGAFAIVNSPRFIDRPGEYALVLEPEPDGRHRLLVWPPDGKPEGLTRGAHGVGIEVAADHVVVEGFWVRKQGWDGAKGIVGTNRRREGTDLTIRDCKVTNLRGNGAGIYCYGINELLVDGCEVADNAGHVKGMLLRNARNIVTRRCRLHRNSSTALDYYTVTNGVVQDCVVTENQGMHANGLTFYVGCKDILIERNIVREGNVGLTLHTGENMIVRNNIIEGRGDTQPVGLWAGPPYDNIVMTNNIFRHHGRREGDPTVGIYGGNREATGYAIVNNIIDGISGNILLKADLHHNIFTRYGPAMTAKRLGDNLLVEDLDRLYVDANDNDYRPAPNSPSIDAGVALAGLNARDIAGVPRPQGEGVDIGPYERPIPADGKPHPRLCDPHTFEFSFAGYEITPPKPFEATYEMRFKKRPGAETIAMKGVDLTGEGGGQVRRRVNRGGYVAGWFQPGHWLEWTVEAPRAGAYEVAIEHGSEMNAERKVLLNGKPVAGLEAVTFPATGAWTTFDKTGLPKRLRLSKGKNTIRFEYVSGHLNFRKLEFIPVAAP